MHIQMCGEKDDLLMPKIIGKLIKSPNQKVGKSTTNPPFILVNDLLEPGYYSAILYLNIEAIAHKTAHDHHTKYRVRTKHLTKPRRKNRSRHMTATQHGPAEPYAR